MKQAFCGLMGLTACRGDQRSSICTVFFHKEAPMRMFDRNLSSAEHKRKGITVSLHTALKIG
jgi:hypothetical protein